MIEDVEALSAELHLDSLCGLEDLVDRHVEVGAVRNRQVGLAAARTRRDCRVWGRRPENKHSQARRAGRRCGRGRIRWK